MKKYDIAIVGATGLVGSTFINVMQEYGIEPKNLYLFASARSEGKAITYMGKEYICHDIEATEIPKVDFALFSAGASVSKIYAPKFVEKEAIVIDNSSYWRMDEACPLIVPEINLDDRKNGNLIANPNCSTIQSILPLYYLDLEFGLKRVFYSSYQAVSGSGMKGKNDYKNAINGGECTFYPYNISKTCIPEIDVFLDNGYTKEEIKMVNETRKILHKPDIPVSATCVRVPVENSHAVSIMAEFEKPITVEAAWECLRGKPGIKLTDDVKNHVYPVSTLANGTDDVYVGRIRKDLSCENGLLLYTVGDNIRKGAAANAVQIMTAIMKENE